MVTFDLDLLDICTMLCVNEVCEIFSSCAKCDRTECPVCSVPDSKGGCRFSNIGYQLVCIPCKDTDIEATYQGESAKSAYERGQQHHSNLKKKVPDTPMWKHSQLYHESNNKIPFSVEVTGRFKKPMIRIRESSARHPLNSKNEFHQLSIIRLVPASGNLVINQEGETAPVFPTTMYNLAQRNRGDSTNVPMRTRSKGLVTSVQNTVQSNPVQPIHIVQTTRAQRNAESEHPSKYSKNNGGERTASRVSSTVVTFKSPKTTQNKNCKNSVASRTATASARCKSKGTKVSNVQKTKNLQKKFKCDQCGM